MKQKLWAAHLFRHDWTSTSFSTNLQPTQVWFRKPNLLAPSNPHSPKSMLTFARRKCPSAWRLALAFLSAACALLGAERLWEAEEERKNKRFGLRRSDRNFYFNPTATKAFISDVTLLETIWFWAEMQDESTMNRNDIRWLPEVRAKIHRSISKRIGNSTRSWLNSLASGPGLRSTWGALDSYFGTCSPCRTSWPLQSPRTTS